MIVYMLLCMTRQVVGLYPKANRESFIYLLLYLFVYSFIHLSILDLQLRYRLQPRKHKVCVHLWIN